MIFIVNNVYALVVGILMIFVIAIAFIIDISEFAIIFFTIKTNNIPKKITINIITTILTNISNITIT